MKKLFLSFAVVLIAATSFAQTAATAVAQPSAPVVKADDLIKFKETVHDFGKIKQGVKVFYDFEFKNISTKPVVIEQATGSCGCTQPEWPKTPIGKGKTDKLKAGFTAPSPGTFTKTITVKLSQASMPMTIEIKGEVLSADDYAKFEVEKGKKSGK